MSISLLSLFVGHDGPAKMGLNLRSLGLEFLYIGIFVFLQRFFICLDL